MAKRILVCHAEGVGNCIQLLPCLRTLKEVLGYKIDMWFAFGSYSVPKLIPYVDRWFTGREIMLIEPSDYVGLVSTIWTRDHLSIGVLKDMKLLAKIQPLTMTRSEVDTYMEIARDLGAREEDLLWYGKCLYDRVEEKFDVVISDGYNRFGAANWIIKSYPYYERLVELLKEEGLSVCSIGSPEEHIKGTVNKTKLPLLKSGGMMKNAKLVISNDSGMAHYANGLGVKHITIFTAMSIDKNYDKKFHKYSELIYREDLDCRPCQDRQRWRRDCKDWKCRDIAPEIIMEKVREII